MRFLCAAICAAFFATGALPAFAYDSSNAYDKPEWYACEQDAECIAQRDPCGFPAAVNKAHSRVYSEWSSNAAKVRDCATLDSSSNEPKLRLICLEKKCVLKSDPTYRSAH